MGDASTVKGRPIVGKGVVARTIRDNMVEHVSLDEAGARIDDVLVAIQDQLCAGNNVRFIGFGTFEVKDGVLQFRPADALQAAIIAAATTQPAKDGDAEQPTKDAETVGDGAPATEADPVTAEANADPDDGGTQTAGPVTATEDVAATAGKEEPVGAGESVES